MVGNHLRDRHCAIKGPPWQVVSWCFWCKQSRLFLRAAGSTETFGGDYGFQVNAATPGYTLGLFCFAFCKPVNDRDRPFSRCSERGLSMTEETRYDASQP